MSGTLHRVILVLSSVVLLFILAVIVISMNRGFDFQDESFYMLCYDYTGIYKEGISSFHIIVHKLFGWMNGGIVGYRVVSLLLTLLSSYLLYNGLRKWLGVYMPGRPYFSPTFLLVYVFLGNFIHYATGVQTVNYNFIINTTVVSCTGLLLGILAFGADDIVKSRTKLATVVLIGALCSLSFFTKFSTGILQVAAYSALFFIYYFRHSFRSRLVILAALFIGVTAGCALFFLLFQSYAEWSYNFITGFRYMTRPSDHPPGALLQSYITNVGALLSFFRANLYWTIALPILVVANRYFGKNKLWVIGRNLFITACTAYFIYRLYLHQFHRAPFLRDWGHHTGYFYPIILLIILLLLIAIAIANKVNLFRYFNARYHVIIVLLLLFFSPLLAVIGTSNSLFLNLLLNAAPWLCLILVLLAFVARYTGYAATGIILVLTILFTATQIIDANTYTPYYAAYRKQKTNLFHQTELVPPIAKLRGVYVDTATKHFLLGMNALLQSRHMPVGYPVWSFSSGVAYLMGGVQIEEFWFNKTCESKANFGLPQKPPVFIVADAVKKPSAEVLQCLQGMGINYPEDYVVAGEVWFPHFQTMAQVLFPKSYLP